MASTKYIWMKKIISQNIAKTTQMKEKCFGICSPPGTPGELSSDDEGVHVGDPSI